MRYHLTLLGWALKLHVLKWSRYREDVTVWIIAIWLTIGMQAVFLYVIYNAVGGDLFGYTPRELIGFLGITLLATGIAQCVIHGAILHLARVVWSGQFDYWLVQPAPLFARLLLEDIGLVWFWPHVIVGAGVIVWAFPDHIVLAFLAALLAAALEAGLILCLCFPAIRWGKWDPSEGIWEYIESSRTIPLGRTEGIFLILASFGILQYSIALDVVTDASPLWPLAAAALASCILAWGMMRVLVHSYSSASS